MLAAHHYFSLFLKHFSYEHTKRPWKERHLRRASSRCHANFRSRNIPVYVRLSETPQHGTLESLSVRFKWAYCWHVAVIGTEGEAAKYRTPQTQLPKALEGSFLARSILRFRMQRKRRVLVLVNRDLQERHETGDNASLRRPHMSQAGHFVH